MASEISDHLHLHTDHNLLDGACEIEKLMDRAAQPANVRVLICAISVICGSFARAPAHPSKIRNRKAKIG